MQTACALENVKKPKSCSSFVFFLSLLQTCSLRLIVIFHRWNFALLLAQIHYPNFYICRYWQEEQDQATSQVGSKWHSLRRIQLHRAIHCLHFMNNYQVIDFSFIFYVILTYPEILFTPNVFSFNVLRKIPPLSNLPAVIISTKPSDDKVWLR